MQDTWHHFLSLGATASEVVAIGFIPLVLLRKKEPSATFAWILVLVFVPVLGVILFWYLGRDRIRSPMRDRERVSAPMRFRLRDRLRALEHDERLEEVVAKEAEEQRGVMRLAARVSRKEIRFGNRVQVIVGAAPTYDRMIAAIEDARDHVHLEYYIFRPDKTGKRILAALHRAAARGVAVRLLYDGYGSVGLGPATRELRKLGGLTAPFFPLAPIRRAATVNLRNHRKIMVVDGRRGFCGGINVGNMFLPWKDVHLELEGPAVLDLQAIFAEDWYYARRQDLSDDAFFPNAETPGNATVQIVESGPDHRVEAIQRLVFAAIASARQSVWITTPYFVPDRAILVALQTAALRGVDVKLIVPRESNHRVTFHAGRSFYDELLTSGVRIYEFLPGMLHTKAMVIDGRFATVGSANLDLRSFRLNFELIAVLYDAVNVSELAAIFVDDLARTEEVALDVWRGRSMFTRIKEGAGRLFSPLL